MFSNKQKLVYAQAYRVLERLGNEYIEKLPKKIVDFLEKFKEHSSELKSVEDENILQETVDLIAALNLKYWETDESRRRELKEIYIENEIVRRASKNF